MAHYIISYDLRKRRDYPTLWALLQSWGAVRVLESLWVVTLQAQPAQIRDAIRTTADADDGVLVIQLVQGLEWSTYASLKPGN